MMSLTILRRLLLLLGAMALLSPALFAQGGQFSQIGTSAEPLPNCDPATSVFQLQPFVWDTTAQLMKTCTSHNVWSTIGGGGTFATISSGTSTAQFLMGSGGTLGVTGTGTIQANLLTPAGTNGNMILWGAGGTISATNTPPPSTITNVSHQWLNSYNATTGTFTQTQPAYADISNTPTLFYQTVDSAGSAQTQRPTVNFIAGSNMTVSCVDNSGSQRTDCTFTSSATASTAFSAITAGTNSNAGTFTASGNTWDFSAATALKAPTVGEIHPGATSGTITVVAATIAGSNTITLPAATGTVAVSATSPITESAAGAVGCATCVTSASSLTLNGVMIGGGLQASSTIATSTTGALFAGAGAPGFRLIIGSDLPNPSVSTLGGVESVACPVSSLPQAFVSGITNLGVPQCLIPNGFSTSTSMFALLESTVPPGSATFDILYANSSTHAFGFIANNQTAQTIPAAQICTNQVLHATDPTQLTSNCVTITSGYTDSSIAATNVGNIFTVGQQINSSGAGNPILILKEFSGQSADVITVLNSSSITKANLTATFDWTANSYTSNGAANGQLVLTSTGTLPALCSSFTTSICWDVPNTGVTTYDILQPAVIGTAGQFFYITSVASGVQTMSWHTILGADLPVPGSSSLGGVTGQACPASTQLFFMTGVSTSTGNPICAQPLNNVPSGSTGQVSFPIHSVLFGEGTSNIGSVQATVGDQVLMSVTGGSLNDPIFSNNVPSCGDATHALSFLSHLWGCQNITPVDFGRGPSTQQTASIAITNLDNVTLAAGHYAVDAYIDSSQTCATPGPAGVTLTLGWTDETGTKSEVLPLQGLNVSGGTKVALGDLVSYGSAQHVTFFSVASSHVTYLTTLTACTTGTAGYFLRLALQQVP